MADEAIRGEIVPIEAARALAHMDRAKVEIAEALGARDVDALMHWRDMAAAAQHYAARRKDAAALAADAGELKLRAERAIGILDRQMAPNKVRSDRRSTSSLPSKDVPSMPTVSSATRANWRKLGEVPEPQFEGIVHDLREDEDEGVTTAAAVRKAREVVPPKPRHSRKAPQPRPLPHIENPSVEQRRIARAEEFENRLAEAETLMDWIAKNAAQGFDAAGGTSQPDRMRNHWKRIERKLPIIREVFVQEEESHG